MAQAQLKLIHPAPEHSLRPFKTYYYDKGSTISDWSAIGRAGSEKGGVRAAFRRVLDGQAHHAHVYDEGDVCVARVSRTSGGISVTGDFKIGE